MSEAILETLELGIQMRTAQKIYFKTRTREALLASKELEKAFDEKISDALASAVALAKAGGAS